MSKYINYVPRFTQLWKTSCQYFPELAAKTVNIRYYLTQISPNHVIIA